MARRNVHLPNDLATAVREHLPEVNISAVLQDALRQMLAGQCPHARLTCADCGGRLHRDQVGGEAAGHYYRELLHELGPLVDQLGTAEGAARIAKRIALEQGVSGAERVSLPRPPRSARGLRR